MKFNAKTVGVISALLGLILLSYALLRDSTVEVSASQAAALIQDGRAQSLKIREKNLYIYVKGGVYKVACDAVDLQKVGQNLPITAGSAFPKNILLVLGFAVLAAALFFRFSGMRKDQNPAQALTKSDNSTPTQLITPVKSSVKFDDVAGVQEAKEELSEIIDYLKNPLKYRRFGVAMPRGVLLVGSPGVGKTLLAKAVAGEANVPFFYQSAATFAHLYVGAGAKSVQQLFACAKQNAPSIVFIDELDAVGKSRGAGRNDEREVTLNQLLTEMDGFESGEGVIVLAATNKVESLDEALLRSGRFDRKVFVDLPDIFEREAILRLYLSGKPHEVDMGYVARRTVGFSGAMLANLVNEAALSALKKEAELIKTQDFEDVSQKVAVGRRKTAVLDERSQHILAAYQASKALAAVLNGVYFEKITLSETRLTPLNVAFCEESQALAYMAVYLSGREGVKILDGKRYTVGAQDVYEARQLAADMAVKYALFSSESQAHEKLLEVQNEIGKILKGHKELLARLSAILQQGEHLSFEQIERELVL